VRVEGRENNPGREYYFFIGTSEIPMGRLLRTPGLSVLDQCHRDDR
jgi:hypothetical protein